MKTHILAASVLLFSVALAKPQISTQRIIVNPVPTDLYVNVWLDKGGNTPSYSPGENIHIFTRVNQDAYVYLFNIDSDGQIDMILPNGYDSGDNFVQANTTKVFPGRNDPFEYEIAAPYGINKVLALASLEPLNLRTLTRFQNEQNTFATITIRGEMPFARKLSIIIQPLPQQDWVSDTARYNVQY
ncbi:DUF4384 domain-containing protein [Deinococcus roseus]|uniref:DUF4384 domain-containing protein n=1 Tax=Deinococcus roseus TaxID=392414 RepID=A0ABQ2CUJ2_9DEIO|nr:DUF4384 domain-containing protein [Deinococcus roseus]GGJ22030.1 hypothetical protein GCM10008938_05390 [Deinococcus roseus]